MEENFHIKENTLAAAGIPHILHVHVAPRYKLQQGYIPCKCNSATESEGPQPYIDYTWHPGCNSRMAGASG